MVRHLIVSGGGPPTARTCGDRDRSHAASPPPPRPVAEVPDPAIRNTVVTRDDAATGRRIPATLGRCRLGGRSRISPTTSASAAPRCRSRRPRFCALEAYRWAFPIGAAPARISVRTAAPGSRSRCRRCNCTALSIQRSCPRTAQGSGRYVTRALRMAAHRWRWPLSRTSRCRIW